MYIQQWNHNRCNWKQRPVPVLDWRPLLAGFVVLVSIPFHWPTVRFLYVQLFLFIELNCVCINYEVKDLQELTNGFDLLLVNNNNNNNEEV